MLFKEVVIDESLSNTASRLPPVSLNPLPSAFILLIVLRFLHNFVHGDLHPGNLKFTKEGKLIILDMGIAKAFTKKDHELLTGVLKCFIKCDGEAGAMLLLEESMTMGFAYDGEQVGGFSKRLGDMARKARADPTFFDEIGNYVAQICDASADYKVKMNQGFISIALAVRVMEGVALALDKDCEIWKITNRYILDSVYRNKAEEVAEWFRGTK